MRVQLHCIARIHVVYLKEVDPLLLSRYNPLPPFSSVHRDKM
uniref:Ycf15 n=1 Tax=Fulcaldea stuessyi TaxID=1080004 RepID=A0A7D5FJZ0_9ASTR|nr:Ycf15 [Fulcaldea stuessyi]YP_009912310.1 Ycf15 [Fulcaldea stuessyi]QLD96816.1 Ycf15 [Fulcaldea stuessyi]QLD96829.1 Ycf15 [Fulcaldea stuessyi]